VIYLNKSFSIYWPYPGLWR